MRLIIARHAETRLDMNGLSMDGNLEEALSDQGKRQAVKLAEYLSTQKIQYIYSSNVMRAVATAYMVSDHMPDITLMLTKDLRIKSPDETYEEFTSRLIGFIKGLENKYNHHTILLIAHSDVIATLLGFFGAGTNAQLAHAGISEFILEDGDIIKNIRINDVSHLK